MAPTPPASSPAARPDSGRTRRRRPQQPAEDEDEDESSSEEESESGDSEESEEDSESEDEVPARRRKSNKNTTQNGSKNIKRPPPRPLNPKANRSRTNQKSLEAKSGSSAPSYEDPDAADGTYRQNSYSYLPTPPSQRQPSPLRQQQQRTRAPPQAGRPQRPPRQRTNMAPPTPVMELPVGGAEDSSYSSSSTASSAGPWKPYAPGSSGRGTPSARPAIPASSRRRTVREPAREPTQAIIPRAPRTVAAAPKIDEEVVGDEEDDGEVEFVPRGPASAPALPAGGKKAALAVELKLNLEIEIELKASIHGDVTLELFN